MTSSFPAPNRTVLAGLGAAALHLAVFLALNQVPVRAPVLGVPTEVEVLVLPTAEVARPSTIEAPAPTTPPDERVARRAIDAPTAALEHEGPRTDHVAPTETPSPTVSAALAPSGPPMTFFSPSPNVLALSGDGPNGFAPRGPAEHVPHPGSTVFQSAAPRPASSQEVQARLQQGLRDARKDAAVGLGPDGPVRTALNDAARRSLAPDRGSALFLAVVDVNGIVIDLRLLSSRGGEQGWLDAREKAAQALQGKKLELRGAKGAELRIEVTSDVLLPSGASAPVELGSRPGAAPAMGTFDVADIGAGSKRVVHTKLVSTTML